MPLYLHVCLCGKYADKIKMYMKAKKEDVPFIVHPLSYIYILIFEL